MSNDPVATTRRGFLGSATVATAAAALAPTPVEAQAAGGNAAGSQTVLAQSGAGDAQPGAAPRPRDTASERCRDCAGCQDVCQTTTHGRISYSAAPVCAKRGYLPDRMGPCLTLPISVRSLATAVAAGAVAA